MKEKFYQELSRRDVKINSVALTQEKYGRLIEEVKFGSVEIGGKKNSRSYWLMKHYNVLNVDGVERLVVPFSSLNNQVIFYAMREELFDILHEIHKQSNHGGRDKMLKLIRKCYKNITQFDVRTYLTLCSFCQKKNKHLRKRGYGNEKEKGMKNLYRGLVYLIDFRSNPDGEYNYVLVYVDYNSKFIILKPLKDNSVEDISLCLFDIFMLFGAPAFLNFEEEREICQDVIRRLAILFPDFRILDGKPLSDEWPVREDIENEIRTTIKQTGSNQWSSFLGKIQYTKNREKKFNQRISAWASMFWSDRKGFHFKGLCTNTILTITTEEELEEVLNYQNEDDDVVEVPVTKSRLTCAVCYEESANLKLCYSCNMAVHSNCSMFQRSDNKVLCVNCNLSTSEQGESSTNPKKIKLKISNVVSESETESTAEEIVPNQVVLPTQIIPAPNPIAILPDQGLEPGQIFLQLVPSQATIEPEVNQQEEILPTTNEDMSEEILPEPETVFVKEEVIIID